MRICFISMNCACRYTPSSRCNLWPIYCQNISEKYLLGFEAIQYCIQLKYICLTICYDFIWPWSVALQHPSPIPSVDGLPLALFGVSAPWTAPRFGAATTTVPTVNCPPSRTQLLGSCATTTQTIRRRAVPLVTISICLQQRTGHRFVTSSDVCHHLP